MRQVGRGEIERQGGRGDGQGKNVGMKIIYVYVDYCRLNTYLKGQCHKIFCHFSYFMNRSHLGPLGP